MARTDIRRNGYRMGAFGIRTAAVRPTTSKQPGRRAAKRPGTSLSSGNKILIAFEDPDEPSRGHDPVPVRVSATPARRGQAALGGPPAPGSGPTLTPAPRGRRAGPSGLAAPAKRRPGGPSSLSPGASPGTPVYPGACEALVPIVPWGMITVDFERIRRPPRALPAWITSAAQGAFREFYHAGVFFDWLGEQSPQIQARIWSLKDSETPVSLKEYFGGYSASKVQTIENEYRDIIGFFTSTSQPLTAIRGAQCRSTNASAPLIEIDAGSRGMVMCRELFTESGPNDPDERRAWQMDLFTDVIAKAAVPNRWKALVNFAEDRMESMGNCLLNNEHLGPCASGFATIRWEWAGKGKSRCDDAERARVREEMIESFKWIDWAKRFLGSLKSMNAADRQAMWRWGAVTGTALIRTQSPAPHDWFGSYTDARFDKVKSRIDMVWNRYVHGTKNGPIKFKCKSHKNCLFSPAVDAYHNKFAGVGTIALCSRHFDSDVKLHARALSVAHENMHVLVDDSVAKSDPADIKDDACQFTSAEGKEMNACYNAKNGIRLRDKSPELAMQNISNYVYWMRSAVHAGEIAPASWRGCWPWRRPTLSIQYGHDQARGWVPPPSNFYP